MRHAIFDEQNPFPGISHSRRKYRFRIRLMVCKPALMARCEDPLMFALKIDGLGYFCRTAKFVMENNCVWVVHHAQAVLPQPRAVIGVFVVGRLETLVEAAEPLPGRAG